MSNRGSLGIDRGSRRSERLSSRNTDSRERNARPKTSVRNGPEIRREDKTRQEKKRREDVTEGGNVEGGSGENLLCRHARPKPAHLATPDVAT